MKKLVLPFICFVLIVSACQENNKTNKNSKSTQTKEISFTTSNNIKIVGDLYENNKTSPVILLFHQGGSNARGEYAPIIPTLLEKGFNILAIDQRVGGQYYGSYNRTLANIPTHGFDDGYGYCDAYNNLEGALEYIINAGFTGNKIIWGSSYSGTLAIQLAAKNSDKISGVLAFSPAAGNSMKDCASTKYFETIKVPLLLLRPPHEMERENAKAQFKLAKENGHQTYIAKHGVHGSSMLVEERVGNDVSDTWNVVTTFLEQVKK